MSEELEVGTPVAGENVQPVDTDTVANTDSNHAESSDNVARPAVEQRDGKLYVDGVRVYTRDDTNRIAAKAREEAERSMLNDLGVDDFGKVKSVVSQLQEGGQDGLNVESLRDAVKKREQTVEELKTELQQVRTEMVLKEHISQLQNAMPSQWNTDQKSAVIDLMKSRDMLHIDGAQFAIRNGDSYLTTDGETPDYASAVQLMGKTLGLPMAKQGVATFDSDRKPTEAKSTQAVDQERMKKDAAYRNAYVQVRERNKNLSRSEITDAMVKKYMESTHRASGSERMLYGSTNTSAKTTKSRRK